MDLQNRSALSASAFLANPTGARVPVGGCYMTSDNCRIYVRLWRYLCRDYATRASGFVLTILGCQVCNSNNKHSQSWLGIITRIRHDKQPSSAVIL